MSWLEEAKKRAENVCGAWEEPWCREAATDSEIQIIGHDAPRAYALLERAREVAQDAIARCACGLLSGCAVCRAPRQLLRDLEGKEETDAQNSEGGDDGMPS